MRELRLGEIGGPRDDHPVAGMEHGLVQFEIGVIRLPVPLAGGTSRRTSESRFSNVSNRNSRACFAPPDSSKKIATPGVSGQRSACHADDTVAPPSAPTGRSSRLDSRAAPEIESFERLRRSLVQGASFFGSGAKASAG